VILIVSVKIREKKMKMVKKLLGISLVAMLALMCYVSAAQAVPTPGYPRLFSDGGGIISYDKDTQILKVSGAQNLKAMYASGVQEVITPDASGSQDFYLTLKVDNAGVLDPTYHEAGHTYHDEKIGHLAMMTVDPTDDLDGLLFADDVSSFSYELGSNVVYFTFVMNPPTQGLIVDKPLPGGSIWPSTIPTVCLLEGHPEPGTLPPNFTGKWNESWDMGAVEIKQWPTPEPSSALLLGLSLLGLVGVMRRKRG
jgi:hypothetical protein